MNYWKSAAVAVALSVTTNASASLISNSGFEEAPIGLTGWNISGGADIRHFGPNAYEGSNYLFGRNTDGFSVWQDIDLFSHGYTAAQIDSGDFSVVFGGMQSSFETQGDSGIISIHLFDEAMTELSSSSLDPVSSSSTWVSSMGVSALLADTRYLQYRFEGTRVAGSNTDAYLDAAYLEVQGVSAVPVPAAMWLFGSGLIGLAGISRRKNT